MQVEHYGLISSMIALRRQGGEALREPLGEEYQLVVVDPVLHQALGVLLDLVQWPRPLQPGRGNARFIEVSRIGQAAKGSSIINNFFQTSEKNWPSCTFRVVSS
jgi:hypothetical protein